MKAELKKTGDLGDIAMNCKSTQRLLFPPPPLTVRSLFKEFKNLAKMAKKRVYFIDAFRGGDRAWLRDPAVKTVIKP